MSGWTIAIVALLPALAVPVTAALRGGTLDRLVAIQLATSISTMIIVLMTFAFDQNSFIDIALAVPLLGLPGTLVVAHFLERWL